MSRWAWSSRASCSPDGTSPTDEERRMTVRGRATRARLIEATVSVVREVGYAHASTRAIAEAAGVAEGTIYRHFPDKASLFFAAVLESNAPVVAWVTTLPHEGGRAHGRGEPHRRRGAARGSARPDPAARAGDGRRSRARGTAPAGDGCSRHVAAARSPRGRRRLPRRRAAARTHPRGRRTPQEAASVLLGMLFALGTMPSIGVERPSPDRVASAVRMLIRGIEPPPTG